MTWEARIAQIVAGLLAFAMLVALGFLFAEAFLAESEMRVERLERHMYDVAMRDDGPAAPTGVRPNYGESSAPNVRHFQDAAKRGGGKP